jgi:hypothetical protein
MHPVDLSPFVEDRRRARERQAAAERSRCRLRPRRLAALWLRRLADRLDPVPAAAAFTPRPAHGRARA